MGTRDRSLSEYRTNILWNAHRWLPSNYKNPISLFGSVSDSLSKRRFCNPRFVGFGHQDVFTSEVLIRYQIYDGYYGIRRSRSAEEILYLMLVELVLKASSDTLRECRFLIFTRLEEEDWEMISSVASSLRSRGRRVMFAVPDIPSFIGSSNVFREQNDVEGRIPVWICPHLLEQGSGEQVDDIAFIEPPPSYTMEKFPRFQNVDTCVFWDVHDYPLPQGLQLSTFSDNIRSALGSHLPCGNHSIYAYVVKGEEFEYDEDAITVRKAPSDNFARLAQLKMDILLWTIDNPGDNSNLNPGGPNLLIISKQSFGRSILDSLTYRGHNVFMIDFEKTVFGPNVISLPWEDVSAEEEQRGPDWQKRLRFSSR
ncbi:uncharacterized protein LOC18009890 [Eutrema salsugineum]|nr:uncharacterized protein LOC18009890 [Eutrema salsugineum]